MCLSVHEFFVCVFLLCLWVWDVFLSTVPSLSVLLSRFRFLCICVWVCVIEGRVCGCVQMCGFVCFLFKFVFAGENFVFFCLCVCLCVWVLISGVYNCLFGVGGCV